ncbi:MAG: GMC family oxidoreductase [Thermoleophilia bacterium]
MGERFDVVVCGAGAAGAAAASRLSDDASRTVLLLDAGPDYPDELESPPGFLTGGNILGHNFAGVAAPTPDTDWNYWSPPLRDGRRVHHKRGKLVGGSTMINGTIGVRGAPVDFDRWQEHGAPGWAWADVKPYVERVETVVPLKRYREERWLPFAKAFKEAFLELGYRWVPDMNGEDAWDGVVGPWPQNRRSEIRMGTLTTYVRRARPRPNFEVRGNALVDRVLLDGGRAVGVRYVDRDGSVVDVEAGEVVVAGGAYGSPSVLLRSGIGPEDELRALGIEPVRNLPVGRGMMEHPQCLFTLRTPPELAEMGNPSWPVAARAEGNHWWSFPLALDEDEGICAMAFGIAEDHNDGTVRLASPDPADAPIIDHRLQDVIDSPPVQFQHAWSTFRAVVESKAMRSRGVTSPDLERSLEEILQEGMHTGFHPAGGCPIGRVVDEELRVHGIEGLRVADASVFPRHTLNNPNLTCMMLGERVATMIAGGE